MQRELAKRAKKFDVATTYLPSMDSQSASGPTDSIQGRSDHGKRYSDHSPRNVPHERATDHSASTKQGETASQAMEERVQCPDGKGEGLSG